VHGCFISISAHLDDVKSVFVWIALWRKDRELKTYICVFDKNIIQFFRAFFTHFAALSKKKKKKIFEKCVQKPGKEPSSDLL
jgi:hypothetical protein